MEFRVIFVIAGIVYLVVGILIEHTSEWARRMKPGDYEITYDGPYIRDADQRVEHLLFQSAVLIIFGIVNIVLGFLLPNDFLNAFGFVSFISQGFAGFNVALIKLVEALDRDTLTEGLSEEEQEKIRNRD